MRRIGKQQKIQRQIAMYNNHVMECVDVFKRTFAEYCDAGERAQLERGYVEAHEDERQADDTRRGLENMMYTEAVFPESRGDILGLIETMDNVANHTESAVRRVLIQHIEIPQEYYSSIINLVEVCHASVVTMIQGEEQLFDSFIDAAVTVGKIDSLESEADTIEEQLIDRIFSGDESDLQKILLRDLVQHLSGVADRAEHVGDRIRIMVAKRSI